MSLNLPKNTTDAQMWFLSDLLHHVMFTFNRINLQLHGSNLQNSGLPYEIATQEATTSS